MAIADMAAALEVGYPAELQYKLEERRAKVAVMTGRNVQTLQTSPLIGQEVQLSSSCPIKRLHLNSNIALIG